MNENENVMLRREMTYIKAYVYCAYVFFVETARECMKSIRLFPKASSTVSPASCAREMSIGNSYISPHNQTPSNNGIKALNLQSRNTYNQNLKSAKSTGGDERVRKCLIGIRAAWLKWRVIFEIYCLTTTHISSFQRNKLHDDVT